MYGRKRMPKKSDKKKPSISSGTKTVSVKAHSRGAHSVKAHVRRIKPAAKKKHTFMTGKPKGKLLSAAEFGRTMARRYNSASTNTDNLDKLMSYFDK